MKGLFERGISFISAGPALYLSKVDFVLLISIIIPMSSSHREQKVNFIPLSFEGFRAISLTGLTPREAISASRQEILNVAAKLLLIASRHRSGNGALGC